MALRIALTVYGKGPGNNLYEKEVELLRVLTAKLRRQPAVGRRQGTRPARLRIRLLDDTKVYGAQASPIGAGGLGAGGPGAGGYLALVDHSQYRGLPRASPSSPDLATLALASIPGVAVAADLTAASTDLGLASVSTISSTSRWRPRARCSTIAAAPPTPPPTRSPSRTPSRSPPAAPRALPPHVRQRRSPPPRRAQANDATALQRWTQGLQAVRLCRPQPAARSRGSRRSRRWCDRRWHECRSRRWRRRARRLRRARHAQPPSPQGRRP